jgi:hypothetical protein
MAILQLGNESATNLAYVFSNKALKINQAYSWYQLASASATAIIAGGPGILHAVIFNDSATATTIMSLTDSATVANQIGDTSAGCVAQFGTIAKNLFQFNLVFNSGLCVRVSGSINPTTIIYSLAS